MLWLHKPNSRGERMTTLLLSANLKAGWRLAGYRADRAGAARGARVRDRPLALMIGTQNARRWNRM
jgi:hypothetical protein